MSKFLIKIFEQQCINFKLLNDMLFKNKPSEFEKWQDNYIKEVKFFPTNRDAWEACKKKVLEELNGFEGEYVCDVIDKIKEL